MINHSPGPWKIKATEGTLILDANDQEVIESWFDDGDGHYRGFTDMFEPDARLIAAAPEMLELLRKVYSKIDDSWHVSLEIRDLLRKIDDR